MSWIDFVYLYTGVMLIATLACRRLLTGRWWRYTRTLAAGTLVLLLGDAIAEERELWVVPKPVGIYILEVPAETVLLILASLASSLLPYLLFLSILPLDGKKRQKR